MKSILKKCSIFCSLISASFFLFGDDTTYYNVKGVPQELSTLIGPYLGKGGINFKTIKKEFSGSIGADKFLSYFTDANSRVYNEKNSDRSYEIRTNVLIGLIGLAWENKNIFGMRGAIKDCASCILYPTKDSHMIYKLGDEQKKFLDEITLELDLLDDEEE
jgi:hypothetical protein